MRVPAIRAKRAVGPNFPCKIQEDGKHLFAYLSFGSGADCGLVSEYSEGKEKASANFSKAMDADHVPESTASGSVFCMSMPGHHSSTSVARFTISWKTLARTLSGADSARSMRRNCTKSTLLRTSFLWEREVAAAMARTCKLTLKSSTALS
jgi:hypothetical protein